MKGENKKGEKKASWNKGKKAIARGINADHIHFWALA